MKSTAVGTNITLHALIPCKTTNYNVSKVLENSDMDAHDARAAKAAASTKRGHASAFVGGTSPLMVVRCKMRSPTSSGRSCVPSVA